MVVLYGSASAEPLTNQPSERPPHPRYSHQAGLRAYESGFPVPNHLPTTVVCRSGIEPIASIRRFSIYSITVAGAAPELSDPCDP
jgi:hypothetical protein